MKIQAALVFGFALALAGAGIADARPGGGHGGKHGGGYRGGHGGGHGHGYRHGHYRPYYGYGAAAVFVGASYYAYPRYYPAPAYYAPAPVYVEQPQVVPEVPAYWYYCPAAGAYYPQVQSCAGAWQRVAPQPPPQ